VIVVPPGEEFLPHALKKEGQGNRHVIEQFPVTYLPSLAFLKSPIPIPKGAELVAGLGFPGSTTWDVEYELRDIRACYKDAALYFNGQAALSTLQTLRADVLHLALDTRVSATTPGNSSITLTDGKTPPLPRTVLMGDVFSGATCATTVISQLRDNADLDNTILPGVFLLNGSSTVVTNVLAASRKAKKFFGEVFYTSLQAGTTSRAAARQVQLDMLRNPEYQQVWLWAPFTVWGIPAIE
jgi:CHAT domain-containing protein